MAKMTIFAKISYLSKNAKSEDPLVILGGYVRHKYFGIPPKKLRLDARNTEKTKKLVAMVIEGAALAIFIMADFWSLNFTIFRPKIHHYENAWCGTLYPHGKQFFLSFLCS